MELIPARNLRGCRRELTWNYDMCQEQQTTLMLRLNIYDGVADPREVECKMRIFGYDSVVHSS